jgi:hypothetical protein
MCKPKNTSATTSVTFLTQKDQTDLLAQLMLGLDKLCDHYMYICMAILNKRTVEPVFGISQEHNELLTDISGWIHPDPVEQYYLSKLWKQQLWGQERIMLSVVAPKSTSIRWWRGGGSGLKD